MKKFIYVPMRCEDLPMVGHDMLVVMHGVSDGDKGVRYFNSENHSETVKCIKLNKPVSHQQEIAQLHNDMVIGLLDRFFRADNRYREKHVALPLGQNIYEFLNGGELWRPSMYDDDRLEEKNFVVSFQNAGIDMHNDTLIGFDDDGQYHNFIHDQGDRWGRIDCPEVASRFVGFFQENKENLQAKLDKKEYQFLENYAKFLVAQNPEQVQIARRLLHQYEVVILQSFAKTVLSYQTRNSFQVEIQNPPTGDLLHDFFMFEEVTRLHYMEHRDAVHTEFYRKTRADYAGARYEASQGYNAARDEDRSSLYKASAVFFNSVRKARFNESVGKPRQAYGVVKDF